MEFTRGANSPHPGKPNKLLLPLPANLYNRMAEFALKLLQILTC